MIESNVTLCEDYVRNAIVNLVIDGDTLALDLDLGFGIWKQGERVRVLGIDTPELKGPTREAGLRARAFTEKWVLDRNGQVTVKTYLVKEEDSFGRVLAEVWVGEESLAAALLASGNAVVRPGEAEKYGALRSIGK